MSSLVLDYRSPYVIVDAKLEVSVSTTGVVRLYYNKEQERDLAYNSERKAMGGLLSVTPEWKKVWEHDGSYEGTISLAWLFRLNENRATGIPHYDGRLKLEFDGPGASVDQLVLRTTIQTSMVALRSLELRVGENAINFYGQPFGETRYSTEAAATCATVTDGGLKVTFRYMER